MQTRTTLGVKLDKPVRERLRHLGQSKDRATHWLIKTAITEYLEREEHRMAQQREDQARWTRYEKTGHFVDNPKAMAWLDALARGKRLPCPR